MTANQRSILGKLVLVNLVVYGILGLWQFGGSVIDQGLDRAQSIAAALQQNLKPTIPAALPARTPTAAPGVKPASPTPRKGVPPPPVVVRQPIPVTAPQPAPGPQYGSSPSSPMMPADSWRAISAGARVWYNWAAAASIWMFSWRRNLLTD